MVSGPCEHLARQRDEGRLGPGSRIARVRERVDSPLAVIVADEKHRVVRGEDEEVDQPLSPGHPAGHRLEDQPALGSMDQESPDLISAQTRFIEPFRVASGRPVQGLRPAFDLMIECVDDRHPFVSNRHHASNGLGRSDFGRHGLPPLAAIPPDYPSKPVERTGPSGPFGRTLDPCGRPGRVA